MTEPLFLPIILGTVREGRESEKVARKIEEWAREVPGIRTELIDIRILDLPMTDEGTKSLPARNTDYQELIRAADGFIIVSPEYNHSFPGSLKRALDVLFEEWKHKAVGVVGVSNGRFGGVRMVEALLPVFKTLSLTPIKPDIYVPDVEAAFDERGEFRDSNVRKAFDFFIEELVWMAETLRTGRNR